MSRLLTYWIYETRWAPIYCTVSCEDGSSASGTRIMNYPPNFGIGVRTEDSGGFFGRRVSRTFVLSLRKKYICPHCIIICTFQNKFIFNGYTNLFQNTFRSVSLTLFLTGCFVVFCLFLLYLYCFKLWVIVSLYCIG